MNKRWKTAVVTGGSSGIGRSLVTQLVSQCEVVLAVGSRKYEDCEAGFPLKSDQYLSIDLSAADAPAQVSSWARKRAGGDIDLVIHDAGMGYSGTIASLDRKTAVRMFAVNLIAPVLLTRELLGSKDQDSKISFVFVSSVVSELPSPAYAAYTATKAAINGFVRNLSAEQPAKCRVIAVHPGATATAMHGRSASDNKFEPASTAGFASPDYVACSIIKKIIRAEERASNVLFSPVGFGNAVLLSSSRLFPGLMGRLRRNPKLLGASTGLNREDSSVLKSILITGAASGIGLALTRKYLESGYSVYALDRDLSGLESIDEADSAGTMYPLSCELSDVERIHSVVLGLPLLDAVIHNAGINVFGHFEKQSPEIQELVLRVNGLAPLVLEQELLQQKKADSRTRTAFVSSLSAFVGYPGAAVYAATKDFVKSYGESLGAAVPGRVTVIYPGPTLTPHARRYSPDNSRESKRMPPDVLAEYIFYAIQKGQKRLIPGIGLRAFALLGRMFPRVTESSLRSSMLVPIEDRVLD